MESATFFKKLLQLSECMLYWTLMLLDVDLDSVVHCRLNFLTALNINSAMGMFFSATCDSNINEG